MLQKLLSGIAVAALLVAPAFSADEDSTWDGLQKVKAKRVDSATSIARRPAPGNG